MVGLAADLCYVNSSKSGIQGLEFFDPRFSGSSGDEESLSLDSLYRKCLYVCISIHSLKDLKYFLSIYEVYVSDFLFFVFFS